MFVHLLVTITARVLLTILNVANAIIQYCIVRGFSQIVCLVAQIVAISLRGGTAVLKLATALTEKDIGIFEWVVAYILKTIGFDVDAEYVAAKGPICEASQLIQVHELITTGHALVAFGFWFSIGFTWQILLNLAIIISRRRLIRLLMIRLRW